MLHTTMPHGRTARRVEWQHLPPIVRRRVEELVGAPVESAASQGGGFTPGFASVLTCTDGSRHFVKAASTKAQKNFADAYREEVRKLRNLPPDAPTPRLLWSEEVADWLVLSTSYVEARAPHRPWTVDDLAAASTMVIRNAALLTPVPGVAPATAEEEFAAWPGLWQAIDHPRSDELGTLAARYREVVGGDTLVHADIRDDNILILADGTAQLCDWNWPVQGAAWLDSLFLLIGPRGDGLDVDAHIAEHPLLATVPPEHIDIVLALLLGLFSASAAQPAPPTSPWLRTAQAWQRDVIDDWIAERRGWRQRHDD